MKKEREAKLVMLPLELRQEHNSKPQNRKLVCRNLSALEAFDYIAKLLGNFFFFFGLFKATPVAYGSSQARS